MWTGRLEQLVKRVGRHADGRLPHAVVAHRIPQSHQCQPVRNGRFCDAVGGIMAAPRCGEGLSAPNECGTH